MLSTFENSQLGSVRVIIRDNEPWFVAKDVCACLGIPNHRDAVSRLDEDEKGVGKADTLGGNQDVTLVSESGLYTLVMRSNKPNAKAFRKWVTAEVLPSIRKNGVYATDSFIEQSINNPDYAIKILTALKDEKAARLKAEEDARAAIRAKGQIASSREAACMRKVGVLTAKNKKLEKSVARLTSTNEAYLQAVDKLTSDNKGLEMYVSEMEQENRVLMSELRTVYEEQQEAQNWMLVSGITWLKDYINIHNNGALIQVGKTLTRICEQRGVKIKSVPHSVYGKVNAYPKLAVEALHQRFEEDPSFMQKYRKNDKVGMRKLI